ncbi:MAG: cytochrome P450 [Alphaproteobacteria bacterium]|nr:cytochrome P450 [Alphaproteobacteria bacterium]
MAVHRLSTGSPVDAVGRTCHHGRAIRSAPLSDRPSHAPAALPARAAPLVPGLPLLGSSLDAFVDPIRFFARCHTAHGPVFRIVYPGQQLTMIAGMEANRLFATQGTKLFSAARTYARVTRELGSDRIPNAHDGDVHKQLRRALAPSLSAQAVDPFLPEVHRQVQERVLARRAGRPEPIRRWLSTLVADMVGLCTAGALLGDPLADHVARYGTIMGVVGVGGAFPEWTLYTPPIRRSRRHFEAWVRQALDHHRAAPPGLDRQPDVLDALLALASEHPEIDERALVALAMLPGKNAGIYLYRLVGFALHEVLSRPDLLQRVRDELDATFAAGPPDAASLKRCLALQGVLLETLRLRPMAVALPRVVAQPFTFGGHTFDAGDTIYLAGPTTHFLDAVFPDADRFEPDRHGHGRHEHLRPHAFAPFGLGAHACMARGYATTLAGAILAGLLHTADLTLPEAGPLRVRAIPSPIPEARYRLTVHGRRTPSAITVMPQALPDAGLLAGLTASQRRAVLADLDEIVLPARTILFHQGDPPDRFYLVQEGSVDVHVVDPERGRRTVATLGPGSAVGEMGLLQGVSRSATVQVSDRGPATLLALGRDAFSVLAVDCDLTATELAGLMTRRRTLNQLARGMPAVTRGALSSLGSGVTQRAFVDGDVILRQGDKARTFYVLLDGTVEVLAEPPQGEPIVVATLTAVDTFGEIGLLERRPRTATVRAVGDVSTLELDATAFDTLLSGCNLTAATLTVRAHERLLDLARKA